MISIFSVFANLAKHLPTYYTNAMMAQGPNKRKEDQRKSRTELLLIYSSSLYPLENNAHLQTDKLKAGCTFWEDKLEKLPLIFPGYSLSLEYEISSLRYILWVISPCIV